MPTNFPSISQNHRTFSAQPIKMEKSGKIGIQTKNINVVVQLVDKV